MHEKEPLFQIYTFVESQKYFNQQAAEIVNNHKQKLVNQTIHLLSILSTLDKVKIKGPQIETVALWFVSGMNDLLNNYLMDKKVMMMTNPASGDGELFTLPEDQGGLLKVNAFIEQFVSLIN